jgi:hypothetical protein
MGRREALDDRHASSGQQMCFEDPAPKNGAVAENSHASANNSLSIATHGIGSKSLVRPVKLGG